MIDSLPNPKAKLVNAAIDVVRAKGYSATRVEDICAAAGVTKGSFFHHFDTKDELGVAAAQAWAVRAASLLELPEVDDVADPLDRLLSYIDLRKKLIDDNDFARWTCYAGTVVQETFATHPALSDACARGMVEHAETLATIIADAMQKYDVRIDDGWSPDSLGLHIQAVIQGAFVVAKASGRPEDAIDSLDHLRRYITLLFRRPHAI